MKPIYEPKGAAKEYGDQMLNKLASVSVVDKVKIGKLNYHDSDIDWATFGRNIEAVCKELGIAYYIKDSLRKCMATN